jgi:uncharacterized protein (DUF983 family)
MTNLSIAAQIRAADAEDARSVWTGLKRGLQRRCPHCGQGALFAGYLAVAPQCASCGHANGLYRADDGPAYFTILLVGHLVVGPLLALSVLATLPPLMIAGIGLPSVGFATLAALPFVKGGWIGVLWGTRASAGDEAMDPAAAGEA